MKSGNLSSPSSKCPVTRQTQTLRQWFAAMCQSGPRMVDIYLFLNTTAKHYTLVLPSLGVSPSSGLIHPTPWSHLDWVKNSWASPARGWKSTVPYRGVINDKKTSVPRKVSCRCMLQMITVTNFLLKFVLMAFLSDAWWLITGHFHITEKPNTVCGWSCSSAASQCIHPHCTTVSLWSGQDLFSTNIFLLSM